MLDHVFSDAIGALRDALEAARLERQALEERFHADVLLGDVTWATSYGMPGEGDPPRIRCDLTLEWPTWSQTSYRQWYLDGGPTDPPEITVELVLRVQQLSGSPEPQRVLAALPADVPRLGDVELDRSGVTVESSWEARDDSLDGEQPDWAVEVGYGGAYVLHEEVLEDGQALDDHFAALGGWISSALVRLGDLGLAFRPDADPS